MFGFCLLNRSIIHAKLVANPKITSDVGNWCNKIAWYSNRPCWGHHIKICRNRALFALFVRSRLCCISEQRRSTCVGCRFYGAIRPRLNPCRSRCPARLTGKQSCCSLNHCKAGSQPYNSVSNQYSVFASNAISFKFIDKQLLQLFLVSFLHPCLLSKLILQLS